jgi:chemotaxis protein methyltransferase CheR
MTVEVARADLNRFRGFLSDRLGLHFDDGKLDELAEYLRGRVERSGLGTFVRYFEGLDGGQGSPAELRAIVEQLTVGETYFCRNPNHYRAALETALPGCLMGPGGPRTVRVLSAGCASGEEAYTLAILAREQLPEDLAARVRILGIDLNAAILEKARAGRYSAWSFRGTPLDFQQRWFQPEGGTWILREDVRSSVAFEERNLLAPDPIFWAPDAFDVIFCRNVLIYFSQEAVRFTVARFAACLRPGGFLFLGDAENLRGMSHDFHLHHTHDTFYYQVRGHRAPAPRETPRAVRPAAPAPPLPAADDDSWVNVIHGSAERISRLAAPPASPAAAKAPAAEPVSWDLSRAVSLLGEERYAEATASLAALPAEADRDPDVQLLRAIVLTHGGDVPRAARACRAVLALDEFNAGAHYLLALCDEHTGDLSSAVRHDQTAIYLDPSFAMPRLHLGRLAKRRGDLAAAREELGRAMDLLGREDLARILLLGGGFNRDALLQVCRAELAACGGGP